MSKAAHHENSPGMLEQTPARPTAPSRILLVGDKRHGCFVLASHLKRHHQCRHVESVDAARTALQKAPFDLVIVSHDDSDTQWLNLIEQANQADAAIKTLVLSHENSAQAAINAMRSGAIDFIRLPVTENEFLQRIDAALTRALTDRKREDRLVRLKKICKQLNVARHEISEQIDMLCADLVCAYQQMSVQVHDAAMASEFRTLIRQELDVEDLLRTALEYALIKTGPTNAAVFLPDGPDRFSLGAYVNFDCPRETIDMALEHLGAAVCPQMVHEQDIHTFDDPAMFATWSGVQAGMLGESSVVAFSCHHEDDCLAVIVLFRDQSSPFNEDLPAVIETLRPIFAEQLAQIIKVHHRAQPEWPDDAHSSDDDFDMNDDADFGFGGLAA